MYKTRQTEKIRKQENLGLHKNPHGKYSDSQTWFGSSSLEHRNLPPYCLFTEKLRKIRKYSVDWQRWFFIILHFSEVENVCHRNSSKDCVRIIKAGATIMMSVYQMDTKWINGYQDCWAHKLLKGIVPFSSVELLWSSPQEVLTSVWSVNGSGGLLCGS